MRRETYETPGPLRLRLGLPVGQMEVETVEGTTTTVELEAVSSDMEELVSEARISCRERGNGHEVVVEVQSRFGIFISLGGRSQDIRLRITCPHGADLEATSKSADVRVRGEVGRVEIKTASGDTSIDSADGDVQFKSASGDFHINHAGGRMQLQTASGDVFVRRVDSDCVAQLVSGDFFVEDARASVSANTVSGDQKIDAVCSGTVESRAVSGDVLIGVRRGSRLYIDANTVSGSTSSEFDLSDAPDDEGESASDESFVEIRVKTVSGDIRIMGAPPLELHA